MGMAELRGLYIPAFALVGNKSSMNTEICGQEEGGMPRLVGISRGEYDGMVVWLPRKLERLEIVGDHANAYGGTGDEVLWSVGRTAILMGVLATCCGRGLYPALKHIVLWYRKGEDERDGWSREEQEEAEGIFFKAGVELECQTYEPWPEGKVGGWRMLRAGFGDTGAEE